MVKRNWSAWGRRGLQADRESGVVVADADLRRELDSSDVSRPTNVATVEFTARPRSPSPVIMVTAPNPVLDRALRAWLAMAGPISIVLMCSAPRRCASSAALEPVPVPISSVVHLSDHRQLGQLSLLLVFASRTPGRRLARVRV
jgi:hypothetical protein